MSEFHCACAQPSRRFQRHIGVPLPTGRAALGLPAVHPHRGEHGGQPGASYLPKARLGAPVDLEGSYLVHGEQTPDGSSPDRTGLNDSAKQSYLHSTSSTPQYSHHTRAVSRSLSRQETFDVEMQGSRDSAYTEPGDSCMETDPYDDPEDPSAPWCPDARQQVQRRESWGEEEEEEEVEDDNYNRQQRGRLRARGHYRQRDKEIVNRKQSDIEEWNHDMYIC